MKPLSFSRAFSPARGLTCLLPLLPLEAAVAQVSPPEVAAGQPTPGATAAKPSFLRKFIFTGGTSLVVPLNDFKQNLGPSFSAATGADFVVNDRVFIGATFSYNRHGYTSGPLF